MSHFNKFKFFWVLLREVLCMGHQTHIWLETKIMTWFKQHLFINCSGEAFQVTLLCLDTHCSLYCVNKYRLISEKRFPYANWLPSFLKNHPFLAVNSSWQGMALLFIPCKIMCCCNVIYNKQLRERTTMLIGYDSQKCFVNETTMLAGSWRPVMTWNLLFCPELLWAIWLPWRRSGGMHVG